MNTLKKHIILLSFLLFSLHSFAQYDYDDELEFKKSKSKIGSLEKRAFNVHIEVGVDMSAVFGKGVIERQDTLDVYKTRYNFDSFNVDPLFFPYAKINTSFNLSKKISLTLGLKYRRIGWREFAKVDRQNIKYRFYNQFEFNYIGIPFALNIHVGKFISFNIGQEFSFLIKNEIVTYEYFKRNGNIRIDKTKRQNFQSVTNINSDKIISQFFIGAEAGTERIRFTANFILTGNFINLGIPYSSISIEAGVVYRLFNDYE